MAAAREAWGVVASVIHDGDHEDNEEADALRITQILDKRDELRRSLERTLDLSRELISRWGVVLTGSSSYSELFDRHVEMIGRVHGLWYFLAYGTRLHSTSCRRAGGI
jgi:hypothetical protein